jgi:hypothetical protein
MSVDMETIDLDLVLDECLERTWRGEDLESCLASHPDHAEELRSLLIVAADMTELAVPRTSQSATEAGRQRMIAAFEAGQAADSKVNQTIPVSIVGITRYLEQMLNTIKIILSKEFLVMHKTVVAIVLVLVVVFGGSAASAYAAQGSLPGDALYPMKTAIEDASVDFSMDSASEVRLYLRLAEKRIAEIESLAAEGRYADMQKAVERFESHVEKAIKGLLVVAQGDPAEARTLAASLGGLMERHAQVLLALMVTSPDGVQATFEGAVLASQEGISAAGEFADVGEIHDNSSPEGDEAANSNVSEEEESRNFNDDEEDSNANESEDENSNENGEDESEDENTNGEYEDEGNLNGDDDDDKDEDENVNGDVDDNDEDEDQNTNGDDEDESDDENTNGDNDSEENSNENGDTGETEDGINENGDDSSEDDSDDANENDNGVSGDSEENNNDNGDEEISENDNASQGDDSSSDQGDESENENDSSEDESDNENDSSEDESNENDNSDSEVEDGANDNSEENENINS